MIKYFLAKRPFLLVFLRDKTQLRLPFVYVRAKCSGADGLFQTNLLFQKGPLAPWLVVFIPFILSGRRNNSQHNT